MCNTDNFIKGALLWDLNQNMSLEVPTIIPFEDPVYCSVVSKKYFIIASHNNASKFSVETQEKLFTFSGKFQHCN